MMDFLEMEAGIKYPWTTYANVPVQEFLYGAMENTTATIFSDYFYQDERTFPDKNYVDINAHELTHQWFGDYVTAWSGSSHWLQEITLPALFKVNSNNHGRTKHQGIR